MANFQFYTGGIKSVVPKGQINLQRFILAVKETKPEMLELLNRIKEATKNGDFETKDRLKTELIFFTPAINCTYRNYQSIINFTGLAPLDFDKLESVEYAIQFKEHLFNEHEEIIACWLSSSGKGVRALLNIPIAQNVAEYKSYYKGFQEVASQYNGYDTAPQNAVLPLFLSNDPNLLYRKDAKIWEQQYIDPKKPPRQKPILIYEDEKARRCFEFAKKSLQRISDAGHPILRATAYTLGGYVGAGYISFSEAIEFINYQIETHPYLSASKSKIDTYKKTAKTMIEQGTEKPIQYEK
jgi:hypothetical protein